MDSTIKIAFTGRRYLSISQVESYLGKLHADYPDAIWITGGAVGLDSIAASFAMAHGIRLWLILPFPIHVMSKYWTPDQKRCIQDCWDYAEKTTVLAPVYDVSIYQRRNERMVDLSDMVAAFWDGSSGGTGNCVRYAQKVGKKMVRFSDLSGVKPHEEGSPSSTPSSYREVHGDIFTSDAEAIVNTVNCVGAMGKGIALEFKKRYPDLYAAYREACARKEIQPGHVWIYQAKDRIIFNAALKVATRTTGTKENPLKIRLREKGTINVFVYLVWKELKPFKDGCKPAWRKEGQTHYYESHAKWVGYEKSNGSRLGEPRGIFRPSYLRKLCELELKEQEAKGQAKPE